jgi:Rod binding domain-containing protein
LKEQLACSLSKKGSITNTALVDMLIKKLISRVHYVQPTESKEFNVNDMVEAFNKKDVRSTKFINLVRQLRDDELDDEE